MDSVYLFLFTKVASTEGFVIAAGVATLILLYVNRREAGCFLLSAIGLTVSAAVLKEVFQTPRPPVTLLEAVGYAFPSGHAAGSVFLAISFAYMAHRLPLPFRASIYALLLSCAVAVCHSRLYLGVHTPFQVGVGALLGALWGLVYILLTIRKFGR
jgi:membrane-associated phospholipid phosphatase